MAERIDFTRSEHYTLSIRLSADGFSFSVHTPREESQPFFETWQVDASCSMTANAKRMLEETEVLKHNFGHVQVLYESPRFTAVPLELFDDEQTEALFYHNFPQDSNETVICNMLGECGVALLFGMDQHVHQLLEEHYPAARFFSAHSPLIVRFAQKSRWGANRKLFAYLRRQTLQVFAFDKGRLLLANSFSCQQTADRLYYLLYIWQQLGFSQEQDELHLIGEPTVPDELVESLRDYLRQVSVISPSMDLNRTEVMPYDFKTFLQCE